jgi:hypothetical protein
MAELGERSDTEGLRCYTEATSLAARRLYERYGYKVRAHHAVTVTWAVRKVVLNLSAVCGALATGRCGERSRWSPTATRCTSWSASPNSPGRAWRCLLSS